ncbi:hypothetical protein HMPREF1433_00304, partial [Helicobacter pylori GAMchJs117Ai]
LISLGVMAINTNTRHHLNCWICLNRKVTYNANAILWNTNNQSLNF